MLEIPNTFSIRSLSRWDWFSLIIPLVALSPLLYLQAVYLWAKPHLQFFPLAYIAAGWFFYNEGDERCVSTNPRSKVPLAIAIAGILLCYLALGMYSSWLAQLATIVLVFAWGLGKFRNLTVLRTLGICGLLAVTLPPPFNWDQVVVRNLQSLSTIVCSRLMDITGILHVQTGNVIEIATKSLFVEEACSGVDSQYALMAVAGTLLLVGRAGLCVSLITILTVPLWAILGNLLRIYSIVIGLEWFGIDLSLGTSHTILGLVTFSLAAWAHWSSVQFLNFASLRWTGPPDDAHQRFATTAKDKFPQGIIGIRLIRGAILFPALLLLLTPAAFLGVIAFQKRAGLPPRLDKQTAAMLPAENALPSKLNGSNRVSFTTVDRDREGFDGQHSRVWSYSSNEANQVASLDLPFRGWHPLWLCYELNGWNHLDSKRIDIAPDGKKLDWSYFETRLVSPDGSFALLHFSLFSEDGNPYVYLSDNLSTVQSTRFGRFLLPAVAELVKEIQAPPEPVTFQFQLLSRTPEAATVEQVDTFRKMYLALRAKIYSKSMPAFRRLMQQ